MNWLTVLFGGVASAIPQVLPFIPQPYAAAATGVIAALTGLYHLYQEKPK